MKLLIDSSSLYIYIFSEYLNSIYKIKGYGVNAHLTKWYTQLTQILINEQELVSQKNLRLRLVVSILDWS